jgi:tetratricopeptide (TPR) repeat protein
LKAQKFIPFLVLAAGLLAYQNSFTGSFVFDDVPTILENPTIRHLWPVWEALTPPRKGSTTAEGRPIVNLSLAVNYAINGFRVWGYHAVNLAIHILAGLTLMGIVRRTLLQPRLRQRFGEAALPLALVIAVIWVVHPLQTESVTYVVQRAESMMGLFYLLTLYCAIRGAESDSPNPWYSLSVASCLLGMASKEVMVSAPLIVLLYDRTFLCGSFREAWRRRWRLYLALAATWILLGYLVAMTGNRAGSAGMGTGMAWQAYALTQFQAIPHYLRLAVWPHPLVFDYGAEVAKRIGEVLPGALIVTAMFVGTLIAVCRWPSIGFLGVWFFAILAPTSTVIPVATQTIAEHRMYLPLAAVIATVVICAVGIGKRVFNRQQGVVLGCVAGGSMVVLFTFLTIQRNQDYSSAVSIWQDTVEKRPNNARAQSSLGAALLLAGKMQEAIGHLERAPQINPNYAEAHYNLGLALVEQRRLQEAVAHFERALHIAPGYVEAHNNLAVVLDRMGKLQEATEHWELALRLNPNFADAHNNLGIALMRQGKVQEAIGHYKQALRIRPDYAMAYYDLGVALQGAGEVQQAIGQYEQALRIKPDYADAHNNLGIALMKQGKVQEAIGHYKQALQIKPDFAEAHYNLGVALQGAGEVQQAIGHWEQALRLKPDFADADNNLGIDLAQAGKIEEAVAHFEQALRLNPDHAEAHNNLGYVFLNEGKLSDAEREFEQALRIKPDYADAHNNLGLALEKLGHTQEAIQHYKQALRIKPDFVQAQEALARARAAQ